jgi:predicted dehydrogenase
MDPHINRRDFLKTSVAAGLGATVLGQTESRGQSANDRINLAIAGVHGRGLDLARQFTSLAGCRVAALIDVDSRYLDKAVADVEKMQAGRPKAFKDFRKALDDREIDALAVATPDHWHAPMAIEAVKAGKHVYVEKPCSHNCREGELLVQASHKYSRLVQMGNQRRSIGNVRDMIRELRDGTIGHVYLAKCYFTRKRTTIGFGKNVPVPEYLDWDLWQGPAPRTAYRDNVHPYNWHWFWNWGTGEALNNGVHFLDLARWALGGEYPVKVSSLGGRWHYVGQDDWECPDTQEILVEYDGGRMISWFGRSTNDFGPGYKSYGIVFFGSSGILDYNGDSQYTVYDLDNKVVKTSTGPAKGADRTSAVDPGLEDRHAANFLGAIRGQEKLNSPIDEGHKSNILGLLGNVSLRVGRTLHLDSQNGHILNDREASRLWTREYEPRWEPRV